MAARKASAGVNPSPTMASSSRRSEKPGTRKGWGESPPAESTTPSAFSAFSAWLRSSRNLSEPAAAGQPFRLLGLPFLDGLRRGVAQLGPRGIEVDRLGSQDLAVQRQRRPDAQLPLLQGAGDRGEPGGLDLGQHRHVGVELALGRRGAPRQGGVHEPVHVLVVLADLDGAPQAEARGDVADRVKRCFAA